jgi:hypothetical protein
MDKKTEALAHKILSELGKINHALHDLLYRPRKQNEKAVAPQDHSDNENDGTERNSPPVSKTAPTPCNAHESNNRWYNPFHWWGMARRWRWRKFLEIVGIVAGIGYAVVTYFQWQEMRTQTMEANRAWLAPSTAHFHDAPVVGKPVRVIFPYENVGRQPAIDMKVSIFYDVLELPKSGHINDFPRVGEDFCRTNPPTIKSGVVFPGAAKDENFTYSDTMEQKINWDASLEEEKNILRVRGCVSYLTFGRTHYSWFCRVFTLRQIETVNGVTTISSRRVGANCPDGNGAN